MKLSELLSKSGIKYKNPQPIPDISINGLTDDSRKTKRGCLFVAIKGSNVDSHDYIPQAIAKGAVAIVGERPASQVKAKGAFYSQVENSRQALSHLASDWYGNPSKKLKIIGTTGTDGKTTTTTLIYEILKKTGKKVGLISTVSAKIGDREYDTGFHVTNPEPLPLQRFLAQMVRAGREYVVLEVTSHGLDQERVAGINFEIGVLTNITHEHLDYHKTFEAYRKAKLKLFQNSKVAVLNKDDKSSKWIAKNINSKSVYYTKSADDVRINRAIKERFGEEYNHYNASAAVKVAQELGVTTQDIVRAIKSFPGVPGRMEEVKNKKGIRIIIDFAHTPNALENVLRSLRRETKRKLVAVFGCAGERDIKKRPLMARVSTRLADFSVFTAEDPRGEDVRDILRQMEKAAHKGRFISIPERGEAIYYAINKLARKGDVVVVCGKGHERSMAYEGVEYLWSDREAVEKALMGKVKNLWA